nr:xylulose kinase-1 [Tanacetum cinerariifolium]
AVQMTKDKAGNEVKVPRVTAQQILARTRERKAKSTLLMAIPDEHLARFHGIKDAKTLWDAIKTRFGGSYGSSSNLQNVDFVTAESTSSTKELNDAYNLDNKNLEKIDQDDLEEIDLKWDCRPAKNSRNRSRDARNAGYRGRDNGKRPAKEEDEKALVVHDGLGTYKWSYQVEEEATDFVFMAFTSNPSSSSSLNSEHEKLSKANLEIVGYQYDLESIEGQLCVHQQNKVIYEEKIRVLEYEVKDKSNLLKYTQKELNEALREKEDLKAKLKKFETSSKNLTKVRDSQISAKLKTGLGFDSRFNEKGA